MTFCCLFQCVMIIKHIITHCLGDSFWLNSEVSMSDKIVEGGALLFV